MFEADKVIGVIESCFGNTIFVQSTAGFASQQELGDNIVDAFILEFFIVPEKVQWWEIANCNFEIGFYTFCKKESHYNSDIIKFLNQVGYVAP